MSNARASLSLCTTCHTLQRVFPAHQVKNEVIHERRESANRSKECNGNVNVGNLGVKVEDTLRDVVPVSRSHWWPWRTRVFSFLATLDAKKNTLLHVELVFAEIHSAYPDLRLPFASEARTPRNRRYAKEEQRETRKNSRRDETDERRV